MQHRTRFLSAALMAAALALSAPAVMAQQQGSGSGSGGGGSQQQNQEPISDAKLERFADAYADIREVRSEYVPKLQQAEGQEEQARLQEEGQQQMIAAIESNDMEVSEYQRIGRRLNNDQELQQRLKQIMQEKQGGSGQQQGGGGQTQ